MTRKITPRVRLGRRPLSRRMLTGVSAAALLAPMLAAGGAQAVQFSSGELTGSFDTTITVGALFRVQDPDRKLIGRSVLADQGRLPAVLGNDDAYYSFNTDDGNLNYEKGLASLAARVTHELKLNYQDFGAFVRATYFYDWVNAPNSSDRGARTNRRAFPDATVERVGKDFDLLDAFVFGAFGPVDVRLGNQVLSWGESTFIANGINTVNPVDVSALRVPGAELRDAFLPVPLASVAVSLSPELSLEGFYQFQWKETEPEAYGSMFSTSDVGSPGGRGFLLSFGNPGADIPGFTDSLAVPQVSTVNFLGARIQRGQNVEPDDSGQYGLALRYFASGLNDSEIGLYFMNYHSRLPVTQLQVATAAELQAGLLSTAAPILQAGALAAAAANPALPPATRAALGAQAQALLTDVNTRQANGTARSINDGSEIQLVYPEDIKLYGISINTSVPFGISLGAEYSLRQDQPLSLDDTEVAQLHSSVILASQALLAAGQGAQAVGNANLYRFYDLYRRLGIDASSPAALQASTGRYLGQAIRGYELFDVSQFQFTATKAFAGGPFGANQSVLVTEVGANWVHDFPENYKLDGPGTDLTYIAPFGACNAATPPNPNPYIAGQGGAPPCLYSADGFATEFSWGYRAVVRFDYLNAFAGINLFPSISFQHDVQGVTPSPLGNFVEDRMAVGVSLRATFLERWTADLGYTSFFGAGKRNLIRDRDFVSASIKYSF